jgi:hypothetical protein
MKGRLFILLAVISLAFALTACTDGRRYHRGYPGYPGYPYGAGYDQVRSLADELEDATSRLEDEAKDSSHHDSGYERDAIDRLEDLDDEAEDFRSEVRDERDLYRTNDDYRELLRRYFAARDAMRRLHAYDYVYREFDRVTRLVNELGRFYGNDRGYYGAR